MERQGIGFTCETAEVAPQTYVMTMGGELDGAVAANLAQAFEGVLAHGAVGVVADLRSATFIDGAAIGVLVAAATLLRRAGGRLTVSSNGSSALREIRSVELESVLPVYRTLQDAVAAAAPGR